jgi:hypothetical protein
MMIDFCQEGSSKKMKNRYCLGMSAILPFFEVLMLNFFANPLGLAGISGVTGVSGLWWFQSVI